MSEYKRGPLIDRFEAKFIPEPNSGCWIWTGGVTSDGYGRMRGKEGKAQLSHRTSYELYCGEIPEDLQVLHHCDTPACVNPHHLFLGTQIDNINDMVSKGRNRAVSGVDSPHAKLNPEKAFEIRWLWAMGRTHKSIAKEYGVTRPLVSGVCRGEIWKPECHD